MSRKSTKPDEHPTLSWFDDDRRVSVYADGTVEIQHGERSYRADPAMWVESASVYELSVGGVEK